MPTTWNAISLGNPSIVLDPTEGNTISEGAGLFRGKTFGSAADPLHKHIFSVQGFDKGGDPTLLEQNNTIANDQILVDLNRDGTPETLTYDGITVYDTVTFRLHDGTTATSRAVIFQTTSGETFLAPFITSANQAPLNADAIVSFTISPTSTYDNDSAGLVFDRTANAFADGRVDGTAGADRIDGSYGGDPGADRIDNKDATAGYGANNSDDDAVRGFGGNDTILSGAGNDTVFGGTGNDSIDGGAGNDLLYGYGDTLGGDPGEPGNDTLIGGAGSDTLYGGGGDDRLYGDDTAGTGQGAADTIDGGTGADLIVGGADGDRLLGGDGNDTIYGDDIAGGSTLGGADSIDAGGGNDSVIAGAGNDTVIGGLGADTVDGNAGNDTIYGDDTAGTDTLGGDDRLSGGEGDDYLSGGYGNDMLDGGGGNDTLHGGNGNDTLLGGTGNDLLEGGAGDDLLTGGEGADTLVGGAGRDTFVVGNGDTVADFYTGDQAAERDVLDLSAYYNEETLAAWNAAHPDRQFKNPLAWMRADQADDGRLNLLDGQSGLPKLDVVLRYDNAAIVAGSLDNGNTAVLCFGADALIQTDRGPVAAGDLAAGALVRTRDAGPQPVRWVGRRVLGRADLDAAPHLRPIRIKAGALGAGTPSADLIVSPQHRVLVRSRIAQRMFGAPEVLVAAKQLLAVEGIGIAEDLDSVTYVHLLFDDHQVVWSNGAETESLHPGRTALDMAGAAAREEILALFPELRDEGFVRPAARVMAPGRLARRLARRHAQNRHPLVA